MRQYAMHTTKSGPRQITILPLPPIITNNYIPTIVTQEVIQEVIMCHSVSHINYTVTSGCAL